MRKSLHKVCSIFVVLALLLSFTACGSTKNANTGEKTGVNVAESSTTAANTQDIRQQKAKLKVLVIYWDQMRKDLMDKYYIPNTKKEFPNYDIEFETGANDSGTYIAKLKTYLSAGQLPDIFFSEGTSNAQAFINQNALLPLNKYVGEDFLSKFESKMALTPAADGNIYALEAGWDPYASQTIYYNKNIFNKYGITVPKTYQELLNVIKTLKSNGVTPMSIDFNSRSEPMALYEMMLYSEDPKAVENLLKDNSRISDPVYLNAAKRVQELVKAGAFQEGALTTDWSMSEINFKTEKTAMLFGVTWSFPGLLTDPKVAEFIGYMPYPSTKEGVDLSKTFALQFDPLLGFSVYSKSKNIPAATEYLKFLVTQDALYNRQDMKAPTAFNPGVEIKDMNPTLKQYISEISKPDYAFPWMYFQVSADCLGDMVLSLNKLVTGEYTPESFINDFKNALSKK